MWVNLEIKEGNNQYENANSGYLTGIETHLSRGFKEYRGCSAPELASGYRSVQFIS